jgi:hypothetical protein
MKISEHDKAMLAACQESYERWSDKDDPSAVAKILAEWNAVIDRVSEAKKAAVTRNEAALREADAINARLDRQGDLLQAVVESLPEAQRTAYASRLDLLTEERSLRQELASVEAEERKREKQRRVEDKLSTARAQKALRKAERACEPSKN